MTVTSESPVTRTLTTSKSTPTASCSLEVPTLKRTPSSISNGGTSNNKQNLNVNESQPKRRISIASDPTKEGIFTIGCDNPAFEHQLRRKISQISVHSPLGEPGRVRKKSILVNSGYDNELEIGSIYNNDNNKLHRISTLESMNAKINQKNYQPQQAVNSNQINYLEESWLYIFCLKCRGDAKIPSWEPPYWQKLFPYPLCPSFRACARFLALILIGALIWITTYGIIGDSAAPGGQLFGLVVLTVAANFGGWLVSLATLPRLIGMLLVGILFQNIGWVDLDGDFGTFTAHLRKFALTIILIRAGLEMEPAAFKKVFKTILKLGVIPWFMEGSVVAVMSHFLLHLPWIWSFLMGSIIAAVSPAVVVPCLFRLRSKGYGVSKGIPTLIIAVAGIDDALSVALFGIISSVMFSDKGLGYQISQAPVCIIGGLSVGVAWGYLARIFPEKGDPYVVPLRTILLFSGGLVFIYASDKVGYEGAGPLATVFAAFTSNLFWCKQGWTVDDNPVATAFEIFWMIFEPILFGVTGATVKINQLDPDIVTVGLGCLATGAIVRIFFTAGVAFGDKLNVKEKFFVAISWMSKATVQAALGPVAMKHLDKDGSPEQKHYAYIVQTICLLSIVLTAPLGAIFISVTGKKLLTKMKQSPAPEPLRRSSTRPSIRDISIIDEEEERESSVTPVNKTSANAQISNNLSFTLKH